MVVGSGVALGIGDVAVVGVGVALGLVEADGLDDGAAEADGVGVGVGVGAGDATVTDAARVVLRSGAGKGR